MHAPVTVSLMGLRTVSETNVREHWRARHRRRKAQRHLVALTLRETLGVARDRPEAALMITLTRIAPRPLDSDNLQSSLKATRDAVADWLTLDDADPLLTWHYRQQRGVPHEYGVHITITPLED